MAKEIKKNSQAVRSNKFWDIYGSLTEEERKKFPLWVQMERAKGDEKARMMRLLEQLNASTKILSIQEVNWEYVFENKPFTQQSITYLTSDLNKHLEDMLANLEMQADTTLKKRLLVLNYRSRNIPKRRLETLEAWEAEVEKKKSRDMDFFEQKGRIYMFKKENLILSQQFVDRQAFDNEIYEYWELKLLMDYLYRICCITEANRAGKNLILSKFLFDNKKLIRKIITNPNTSSQPSLDLLAHISDLCLSDKSSISKENIDTTVALFKQDAHLLSKDTCQNLFRILLKIIYRSANFDGKNQLLWELFSEGIEQKWLIMTLDAYKYFVRILERKKQERQVEQSFSDFLQKHENKWKTHQKYANDIKTLMKLEDLFSEKKYHTLVLEGVAASSSFSFLSEEFNAKMLLLTSWYICEYTKEEYSMMKKLGIEKMQEIEEQIETMIPDLEKKVLFQLNKNNYTEQAAAQKEIYFNLLNGFRFLFGITKKQKEEKIDFDKLIDVPELAAGNLFFTHDWAKTLLDEQKKHL